MIGIAIPPVGNTVTGGSDWTAVIAAIVLGIAAIVLLGLAVWGVRAARRAVPGFELPASTLPRAACTPPVPGDHARTTRRGGAWRARAVLRRRPEHVLVGDAVRPEVGRPARRCAPPGEDAGVRLGMRLDAPDRAQPESLVGVAVAGEQARRARWRHEDVVVPEQQRRPVATDRGRATGSLPGRPRSPGRCASRSRARRRPVRPGRPAPRPRAGRPGRSRAPGVPPTQPPGSGP